jgi:hypothetical protein
MREPGFDRAQGSREENDMAKSTALHTSRNDRRAPRARKAEGAAAAAVIEAARTFIAHGDVYLVLHRSDSEPIRSSRAHKWIAMRIYKLARRPPSASLVAGVADILEAQAELAAAA